VEQPEKVEVSGIDVGGDSATALVAFEGRIGMLRADSAQEAENIACWIGRMERMSDTALEDLLFGDGDVSSECTAESNAI
jgi:hypothetical protein